MEINTNLPAARVNGSTPARKRATTGQSAPVSDSFTSSTALEVALNNISAVRPEAVAHAKELIADPNYPSADIVKKLSEFFSNKLQSNAE
jgi:hypothetical protein